MYLHIGNNKTVREDRIIGIFDADSATVSAITRRFLSDSQKKNLVESSSDELPRSFVLFRDRNGRYKVCFSQLSTSALSGRAAISKK